MKQQVNFYLESFKPKREFLSLENMILVWITGLMLSVVLYVFEADQLERIEARKDAALKQQTRMQSQLRELESSFADRGDLTVLTKMLEAKKIRHSTLNAVLLQLGLRTGGMEQGIAGIMQSMTGLKLKKTWLTEISIYQGQLSVMGQTRDPKQIPELIRQLEQLNNLSDKRFARLQVLVDEESDLHNFSLQSVDFVAPARVKESGQ